MAKSSALMLFAVHALQRRVPESETRQIEEVPSGRVFQAASQEEFDSFLRLGAAREPTKDEITLEEARQEREGEVSRPTILASTGTPEPVKAAEKPKAGTSTKPAKTGDGSDAASIL